MTARRPVDRIRYPGTRRERRNLEHLGDAQRDLVYELRIVSRAGQLFLEGARQLGFLVDVQLVSGLELLNLDQHLVYHPELLVQFPRFARLR